MSMLSPDDDPVFSRSSIPTVSVSADMSAIARTNASRIVNGLAVRGQKGAADIYGKDVSTISKWVKDGEFDKVGALLASLGLKVVPMEWQCVDMAQLDALLTLNRAYVVNLTAEKLVIGEA